MYERWVRPFLRDRRPDVVHFHHTMFLGLDLVRVVRETLPNAAIVYTLHDFYPICANRGQLFKTNGRGLCEAASPGECHRCFPDVAPLSFARRSGYARAMLAGVDVFVAPSQCLADKFATWGIPKDRLVVEDYGRVPPARVAAPAVGPDRRRFGYFGQLNPFKGVHVLLEAVRQIATRGELDFSVRLNSAGLEMQAPNFRENLGRLIAAGGKVVADAGSYSPSELPDRMAAVDWVVVPSVWWENSPLVIQEAFAHGRPVICSDVGGMAEKVRDGVDGLHFRVGDPDALAAVLTRAATEPGLWDHLRRGVRPPSDVRTHLGRLKAIYTRAAAEKARSRSAVR